MKPRPIVPENGRPLHTFKLEVGHAVLWCPRERIKAGATITPSPATIARFTDMGLVLRFMNGLEQRRLFRTQIYSLFFRGWCPRCRRPAHAGDADPLVLWCPRCGETCEGLPPPHVYPFTVRHNLSLLDLARRYRILIEREWLDQQFKRAA